MKKGYVVLENGLVVNGKFSEDLKNIVGKVLFDNGQLSVECLETKAIFDVEVDGHTKLENTSGILGKIVTDELPLDYHMYDLKTIIS